MDIRFIQYNGDLIGLPTSGTHLNFRWIEPDCKVLFSVTQKGRAASCHFASDIKGLRKLKQAIDEFCGFCFYVFEWCRMIIAKIQKPSVERLVEKCGFINIGSYKYRPTNIWIRRKDG